MRTTRRRAPAVRAHRRLWESGGQLSWRGKARSRTVPTRWRRVKYGRVCEMRGYARSFYVALTGSRAAVLTVIVATVLSSWTVQPARAHLFPPDLAFYGPFGGPTVRCQRALGHAAQRCFRRVLTAKRLCMDAELAGGTCDRSGRDAEISAAQQDGQDAVVQACLGGQLTELRFIGFDEAKMDVAR